MSRPLPTEISRETFDAIIIGAGINGAGIARDASMRGLRVLLLDKGDLAGGTSAWSTRLIHGGLRYLEHGELGLVRESLRERETLLRRIAPHLVRPVPMLIPIYEGARRGRFTIRAGMLAYDLLSFDKSLAPHRMLSAAEALSLSPGLRAEGLKGAALYWDAQVEYAERLVVENALSAREHGALVLTYARVERLMIEGGAVRGVEFKDLIGGGTHAARAHVVVNAAGPWVDEVLAGVVRTPEKLIGGTKGSHLVVAPFKGAPEVALYTEARADSRPFFIIPWDGKYLLGTTDARYAGDLDRVEADDGEIDYLLSETNRVLPSARLTRDRVLYTYSGVRPLPASREGTEAGLTRRHFIHADTTGAHGLVSIVGGKLTTYRSLAEQTVDLLFRKLGRRSPPCSTGRTPLPGAQTKSFETFRETFKARSALAPEVCERLLRVYGVRAVEVARIAAEIPELQQPLCSAGASIGAEIVFSFRHEMAETLCDALLRRTMDGLDAAAGLNALERAAQLAQRYLGWDDARAALEVAAYRRYVERFHPLKMKRTEPS
jgi:glycerol-3-phosphate dehydrogenase